MTWQDVNGVPSRESSVPSVPTETKRKHWASAQNSSWLEEELWLQNHTHTHTYFNILSDDVRIVTYRLHKENLVTVLFGEAEDDVSALGRGVGGVEHLQQTSHTILIFGLSLYEEPSLTFNKAFNSVSGSLKAAAPDNLAPDSNEMMQLIIDHLHGVPASSVTQDQL